MRDDNVLIRLASADDAEGMLAIYAPVVRETAISFELEPPSVEEFRGRIETTLARYPWLACEIDGVVAGYAYASEYKPRAAYRWSVEVTVYVSADFRRRGVGGALYSALFERLRAMGFYNAYAAITLPNDASVGLHESFGFEHLGTMRNVGFKLGEWRDVGWWQMGLRESVGTPGEVLTQRRGGRRGTQRV